MLVLALALVAPLAVCADDVPEKRVTIYRTYGVPIDGGWRIPVRIWVAEEPDTARRPATRG